MEDSKIKKIFKAKVITIKKVSNHTHFIEIECENSINVKAGQFISIYCEGLTLRRPFSIFSNNNGRIGILFKERGKGTEYIKSLKPNSEIDIVGPFGNGFDIQYKKALLIGAGIGVAPISFLKSKLDEEGIENIFIAGFVNKEEVPNNIEFHKCYTDDGSLGEKGSVLNYIALLINKFQPEIIYACGPHIVLKYISELGNKYGIETQVAMEKVMACGIGVCRGCIIDIKKDGKVQNASVCKDGPVFKGNEVIWND